MLKQIKLMIYMVLFGLAVLLMIPYIAHANTTDVNETSINRDDNKSE